MNESRLILVSNQLGFTLLEILIAISILAFISLGVVNITENAVVTKERTTKINENNLQIETAMSRFEWDFSQIYSPLYFSTLMDLQKGQNNLSGTQPNTYLQQYQEQLITRFERNEHFSSISKEGIPIPRFYNPEKFIFEFFTTSNRRKVENQKQSHFAWVRYTLGEQEQTDEEEQNPNLPKSLKSLVRYLSSQDPYSDKRINIEDEQGTKGAVLLRNVENLEFQFWDYQKRKWETSLRNIQGGEGLIRGVKIFITWYDSFGNKRSTTRIFRTLWPIVSTQDQNPVQGNPGNVGTSNSTIPPLEGLNGF
jgi:prepilin-type N-terminal cleavage/methylation domain-containing protein